MSKTKFFFYGTLMHKPLAAQIVGRTVKDMRFTPAIIRYFKRVYAEGASFPLIKGSNEKGVFVDGMIWETDNPDEIMALDAYEGGLYHVAKMAAYDKDGNAHMCRVYLPDFNKLTATDKEWTYEGWKNSQLGRKYG